MGFPERVSKGSAPRAPAGARHLWHEACCSPRDAPTLAPPPRGSREHPMADSTRPFRESNLYGSPIRDLKLAIDDTRLAPVIEEFRQELAAAGISKVAPTFYLSTEWGVPFGTVAIGIPFYLARPELTELHGEEVGHIEGFNRTGHPALSAPRDGSRRELRLQAVRPRGVGEAVRLDHAAVSRGVSAAAVQPPVRAPLAGLVCAKASGRGLVGDVRRVDDAGQRLACRLCAAADGAREARVLRAHGRRRSAIASRS